MKEFTQGLKLPKEKITESVKETEEFARFVAKFVEGGDCLAFLGGMGVGKTAFVRGLSVGMGVKGEVASPTFSIVNEYSGEISLIHFDMYRVSFEDDLVTTGFFDYLNSKNVLVVEWSENILEFFPDNVVWIEIENMGENKRKIKIRKGSK
ncbi:MAG: tRNA (adenosine(37)-N6)-threonylcarbamoyltransferase complex ATPase subunit type 1 TsaE [Oscillospiraceae bacterium]|nr:tRNA (adenosine(37)-N6)-threonylcarbamoyltransferase complex ATPase subunit type 1 TsaE [Oscillospiraceae bacterium]